jgi:3-mercaptopyruvate sulfurtransferase SseA
MARVTRWILALTAAVGLLAPSRAAAADWPAGPLVDVGWLSQNLQAPNLRILDASPAQLYAAKHIPGALSTDFLAYGFPERPLAEMERRYQSWGLSPGTKVVIYDQGGSYMATRLHYALYQHGFPAGDLYVLDGGLAKWQERGLSVTTEPAPSPPAGSFRVTAPRAEVRVGLEEVLAASGDPERHALVEALGPDWHFGELAFFGRPGHIPHAILWPTTDLFNPDKTFKSPEEIRKIATHLGIRPDQRIHTHCGGGVAASAPFFALRFLLGYPHVTLFQESQMGWVDDDRGLPFWTYDAPYLLRDAGWLNAWGGQRLRAFGASRVSIVDVRPAAAYEQGHVAFALGLPPDVFRRGAGDPAALGRALGAAGVDPTHEAVVVSGGGLTKDAALAFVMLERAGQRRTSLFLDPHDAWAGGGLTVATTPTAVGPRSAQAPLSIPPATFTVPASDARVIADPARATRGAFPRVFVASGATVPQARVDGTVVHVPHTSLLDANGAPKAAKDLWSTLTAAGVTRYAELICYAEDPGEAAVTYVILRLMGYPDVKVWLR